MDSFWSWFWLLVYWFLFFAYLIVLFQIVGDLFRDRALSGLWKAVWLVFLIVFPYLTALVYVIARGGGMADRQVVAAQRARVDAESYIREVAHKPASEQIAEAKALLDAGAITPEEFGTLKAKALA